MRKSKRFLSMLLTVCMLLGLFPGTVYAVSSTHPFTDVDEADWFSDAVQYVYENGLMSGTSATTFDPQSNITRGQIVTILHRLEGSPSGTGASFTDVASGEYYADAVAWASANGIMGGYGGGLFGPTDPITREQLAATMYRYARHKGYDTTITGSATSFSDGGTVSSYAVDAVNWAIGAGLLSGMGDNMFSPAGTSTRAQAAMVLMRFCENIVPSGGDTTPTIEYHTVTFDYNYDSKGTYDTATVEHGKAVAKPANPSRSGYTFNGWYAGKSGGRQFDFKTGITSDLTLYAHWSSDSGSDGGSSGGGYVPPTTYYTVTFDANGGVASSSSLRVASGSTIGTLPTATWDGHTFLGWFTAVAGGTQINTSTRVTGDIIVYAQWSSGGPGVSGPYTRGEWIGTLADMVNMNLDVDDVDDINYSYADIEDSEYGIAIETAERYGILPEIVLDDADQDVPLFYPDATATREFAAITAVRAMGFTEGITEESDFYGNILSWADYSDIDSNYVDEVAIAVGFGFLTLDSGNRFDPASAMTDADAASIRAAIDALNASTVLAPEDEYDNTTYADGVIKDELDDSAYMVSELGGGLYTVIISKAGMDAVTMGADDVIVLPANDDYPAGIAFKIVSAEEGADSWTLACSAPELWEVYDEIDFSGHGTIAVDSIETPEGIEVEYDPNGIIEDEGSPQPRINVNLGGSTSIPGTLKFTIASKTIGNLKLKGSVEVEIPEVTGIVKGKFGLLETKLDEFTLSIKEKIKIKGDLTYTLAESGYELTSDSLTGMVGRPGDVTGNTRWENGSVEIGRVPIPIVAGLSFDIVFFYNVSIKGTTSITYTIESKQGFQYKNGTPRWIFEYNDSLDFLEIRGSAKAGLGIRGVFCALSLMDLIGIETEGGVGFNASFTPHILATDTLFCADVTLYPYWETSLSTDTAVGKFLESVCHYTLTIEHLKNDSHNSFKLGIHIENCKIVPECTFGRGCIVGHVAQADDTTISIGNARVNIYTVTDDPNYPGDPDHATTTLSRTRYTDSRGDFKADNLTPGTYKVVVSATGYTSYSATVVVESTGETVVESFLMVDRQNTVPQTVTGDIMDAVTGNGVAGTSYTLRVGQNIQTGAGIESGTFPDSTFTLTLNPGTYTLEVRKDDYITAFSTITVTESGVTGAHITLTPVGSSGEIGTGIIRIVLTWGEQPWDLDSHLFGPVSDNASGFFHTYFSDREYYDNSLMVADLDRDDTDSYGPETTTIHEIRTGKAYSFYVHDYTNRSSSYSTAMSMSGAVVRVYNGNTLIRTFAIPVGRDGTVWHVFDYDPLTDTITPVNTFSYSDDPGSLGVSPLADGYFLDEDVAIQIISSGVKDTSADTPDVADDADNADEAGDVDDPIDYGEVTDAPDASGEPDTPGESDVPDESDAVNGDTFPAMGDADDTLDPSGAVNGGDSQEDNVGFEEGSDPANGDELSGLDDLNGFLEPDAVDEDAA